MAKSMDQNPTKNKKEEEDKIEEEEEDEEVSFEELGLDPRLIRALSKHSITKPTPIQREGIPLILVGRENLIEFNSSSSKFCYS